MISSSDAESQYMSHKSLRLTNDVRIYDKLIDLYVSLLESTHEWQRLDVENRRRLRPSAAMDGKKFIDRLIARDETREWSRLDEWHMAIESHVLIARHVHDPHDWDEISTAIDLVKWVIDSR